MADGGIQPHVGAITDRGSLRMSKQLKSTVRRAVAGWVVLLILGVETVCPPGRVSYGQTRTRLNSADGLQQKLDQRVEFTPRAAGPLEQLIEVAKAFQIPMGIEWMEPTKCQISTAMVPAKSTVRQLLIGVVSRCPAQHLSVSNGMVHIRSGPVLNRMNILNLRVRFQVTKVSLFTAEHDLRIVIDEQLHPQEYENGSNGGYGYGPGEPFAVPNVTFSGTNITVREVLDGIARSNRNALWVVRLNEASLKSATPLAGIYKKWEAIVGIWRFVPFKE